MAWTKGKTTAVAVVAAIVLSGAITVLINSGYFGSRQGGLIGNRLYNNGINNAHSLPNPLYTYPDGDEATHQYLIALLQRFRAQLDPARAIKSDRELTEQDVQTRTIYIYGTPQNHALFRRVRDQLPLVFENDGVVVGKKKCMGSDVGAIFVCPNPLNPAHRLVIYGTVSPEALKNMNGVFHGPTDYVVFNNTTRQFQAIGPSDRFLVEGVFDKSDSAHWRVDEKLQILPPKDLQRAASQAVVVR